MRYLLDRMTRLHVVDLAGGEPKQLTHGPIEAVAAARRARREPVDEPAR